MISHPYNGEMRLYDTQNCRLYLNSDERHRFIETAKTKSAEVRSFCLTLVFTGCRISEALELKPEQILEQENIIVFRTLKTHGLHRWREVPVPSFLIDELLNSENCTSDLLWSKQGKPVHRITAYRWVKQVMREAGVFGPQACPKGLRHGFGIHATRVGVQLHMLQ